MMKLLGATCVDPSTAARGRCCSVAEAEGVRAVLRAKKDSACVEIWAAPSDLRFAPATSPAKAVEESVTSL